MQVLPKNLSEFLIRTYFKNHHLFLAVVLLRTTLQFSHKSPGKFAVLLRTAMRFSPKTFFKNQPSVPLFPSLAALRASCGQHKILCCQAHGFDPPSEHKHLHACSRPILRCSFSTLVPRHTGKPFFSIVESMPLSQGREGAA